MATYYRCGACTEDFESTTVNTHKCTPAPWSLNLETTHDPGL